MARETERANDPHAGRPVLRLGPRVADARLAVILVHGRGGSPDDMLGLAQALRLPDVAYLAPAAAGGTWYPHSFLAPIRQNEPHLSSALKLLSDLLDVVAREGMPHDRIALAGFSQGACLSLEFAAGHARRYGAVIGLSGGVIGPPGMPRAYGGTLDGTPVFLGCSDRDPHIPLDRVHESAEIFRRLGASVDERIYPGMGHTVNSDEIEAVGHLLRADSVKRPADARVAGE
jgi:predicted esterase